MIELHVEPRVSKDWDEFRRTAPPASIALDGYVVGPPAFDEVGPHATFDHHAQVDRLATRSTCMQVYMAVTVGLFETFPRTANVFVNDPDQDTCLAVWLLRHPERVADLSLERPIARLLLAEDLLDCTGGAYPVSHERPGMQEQAWVFDPYMQARFDGGLWRMDAKQMRGLIDEVCERIDAHARGDGRKVKLDVRHEELGGGPGWRMLIEHGAYARTKLFASGVRAFVVVRENGDGSWTYTLGKMSPFVPFPVQQLYSVLNEAEGLVDGPDGWGGSNTIGGSPRQGGSRLDPQRLESVINAYLR